MPIAGPISILITSNALKGKLKYCNLLAIGSSIADFLYVFVAVYGITHFFTEYKSLIPYILGAGSLFLLFVGIKIIRTKFDPDHIDEDARHAEQKGKRPGKGAFYTGFMVNLLNPTLFFSWMISSFFLLSFAASLGFYTGELTKNVDGNLNQIEKMDKNFNERPHIPSYLQFDTLKIMKKENRPVKVIELPRNFHFLTTLFYSVFLSAGSILWFFLLAVFLVKFRKKININILNWIVRGLGLILCLFGVFFGYSAVKMLL